MVVERVSRIKARHSHGNENRLVQSPYESITPYLQAESWSQDLWNGEKKSNLETSCFLSSVLSTCSLS